MVEIVAFAPRHLIDLKPQAAQAGELLMMPALASAALGPSFAAIEGERVLCVAGLAENHAAYATAWALFAEDKGGAAMLAITRAMGRVIEAAGYARIDMLVRAGFGRAADFAALLGFRHEATLGRYGADGSNYMIFARIGEAG